MSIVPRRQGHSIPSKLMLDLTVQRHGIQSKVTASDMVIFFELKFSSSYYA